MNVAVYDGRTDPALSASLEECLVTHFVRTRFEDVPAQTIAITKGLLLDTVGATMAADSQQDIVRLRNLVSSWGGLGESHVVGLEALVPAHHAALVNGTMARAMEIDDVHEKALLHSTATLAPVAIAAAELAGNVSGKEFLASLALGIDLAARFSLAVIFDASEANSGVRSMSYTYQTGILMGSLVAGRILGFSTDEMRNVLGVAYSQCAGNQQCLLEGVLTVRAQQGLSGLSAILAARLAAIGISGAMHSLEGPAGYFNAFHKGAYRREVITTDLGKRFEVDNVSIKPYPGCKFTHTAISAALEIRANPLFALDRLDRIVAHVNDQEYFDIVCRPNDPRLRRQELAGADGFVRAQFCLAYLVAVALVHGRVDLEHLSERSRLDETVLQIADKIETVIDADEDSASLERVLPAPGILDVFVKGVAEPIRVQVDFPKGHPSNRMSYGEIAEKFLRMTDIVGDRFNLSRREKLVSNISSLETLANVTAAFDVLWA